MAITIKPVRGEIEPQSIGSRSTTTFLDSAKSNAIDFNKTQRIVSNEMIRIKNHNEKMELQRIKNKTTKYDSLMSIDVTNFNQKLKEGDKNGAAFDKETLDNLVDKFGVDMVKKYKNGIFKDDERSWGVFESYFYTNLNKAYDGANTVTNQKILADSAMSWSIHKTKQKTEISDQKAGDAMWIAMEAIIAKEKEEYSIAHNAGNTNIDIGANLESIRREFWIKAVTGGHEKELENGEKGIDWDSVLANLNKETEWYGKKLTDKDKRWLVDYAEGEMRQQNFTENTYITNYNRNLFNDNIDKVLTGEFKISDIKGLKFKGGEEGFKLSQGMIGIAEKVQLGEMGNESNIDNFLELREMLLSGKLTSLTEKITLQTDEDNTEPRSILERVGTDISDTDFGRLLTLYNNKDNKEWSRNKQELDELIAAVAPLIEGRLKKHNLFSQLRMYNAEQLIEKRFWEGIANGDKAEDLLTVGNPKYIFKDIDKFILSIPEQAEEVKNSIKKTSNVEDYGIPKYDEQMQVKYPTKTEWMNSPELLSWVYSDYPKNTILSEQYKAYEKNKPVEKTGVTEDKKELSKNEKIITEANELGIKYELIPPRPKNNKSKNYFNDYRKKHPNAISISELEKLIQKEKLKRNKKNLNIGSGNIKKVRKVNKGIN